MSLRRPSEVSTKESAAQQAGPPSVAAVKPPVRPTRRYRLLGNLYRLVTNGRASTQPTPRENVRQPYPRPASAHGNRHPQAAHFPTEIPEPPPEQPPRRRSSR